MAPSASTHYQASEKMASRSSRQSGQKPRRSRKGIARPRNITEDEKRVIRELYASGYTGYQIEEMTGIGHSAVYNHIGRTKASTPSWTDDEIQILVDGYFEGMPVKEIAQKVQKSERAVCLRMCRYRQALRRDERKQMVLRAFAWGIKQGLPANKILVAAKKADILREVEPRV